VAAAAVLAFAPQAKAQQPATPGTSKTQPKSAGKPEPAQAAPQPPAPGAPIFLFSPWAKICGKDGPEGSDAKQVCAVISEARVEGGQIAATAALVEPADQSQNILRVTLPLGVRLPYGTRIIVDQGTPLQSGYIMCLVGCISDYQVGPDLMEKLRKGRQLTLQAINPGGAPISVDVPLEGFAKAVDGPATDEKVVASQQKKLEEQLKARAEETRKRLETTGGAGVPFATAPGTK
jgi:invasion protein IalB